MNNDCGVLTPLDPMALKRMRYVNLTSYDFTKVYDLFYKAFYERKELTRECFIYCSEGNNLVRMFNEELKPIKDIKKNDLVFGNKRVLETFKRQYNGEIYSLKICGIPSYPLNITPEHPILAIKKKDVLCKRKEKKQICYRSFSNEPKKYCNNQNCDKIIEFKPQFYKTQDLEVDDLVLIPTIGNINDIITQKINEIPLKKGEFKNFNHEIKWNKDLFRLFGYYLAEGHIEFLKGISYGIGFSFHKKEREYINEVKNLMKKIFNIEGKETKCNSPNVIQIKFNSKPISNFIIKYCNYHSYEKKCSTDIMTTHPKLQLEMFKTWINGDGQLYKRKSNKKNISLIGTTTSKKLALQMYLVLLRNNIIGSIKKRGKIENYSYKILGRKIEKRHQIYDVMVRSNQELNKIGYNVGKQRSKLRRKLFNEKYILSPIMNIKKEIKETTVYNIYCEDHQYPLNFIMNHNCDPPYPGTEKYYGKKFDPEFHHSLIDRMIKTPFHFMLSIGGECEELYVEPLKDEGWNVKDVYTRYSTDANSQDKIREYLIMNYDINLVPDIKVSNTPTLMKYIARK
ncbi:MAG: hypothetical protein OEL89_00475 [Candidatus Peregrinibacteria bacterium]|nr:hypothetical protein [Candidatus Peregrinibacteria bacterium]